MRPGSAAAQQGQLQYTLVQCFVGQHLVIISGSACPYVNDRQGMSSKAQGTHRKA